MTHQTFLQRPSYGEKLSLNALRKRAQQGRAQGHYNVETLWWFRAAWQRSRKLKDLLAYVYFRRDLGYSLPKRYFALCETLLRESRWELWWQGIGQTDKRLLQNLLNEAKQRKETPQVAPPYQRAMTRWHNQKQSWHILLTKTLAQSASIAVVGNSPNLHEQNQGAEIDQHDMVVRFNQFQSGHTRVDDIGKKLSLWVMAPGYDKDVPERVPFIVVTGPAMLHKQQNWSQLKLNQSPVMDIPLHIWRALVREFAAPPSAGLLTIAWLQSLTDKPIKLYGFGFTGNNENRYHHANPQHQAVGRHNWSAEQEWLKNAV